MPQQFAALHLVGDATSVRANAARAAVKTLQLSARIRQSPNLPAAIAAPIDEPEVLVLLDPTAANFKTAFAALDQRGLPRWAVVPPWQDHSEHPASFADAWDAPALGRSIGFALSLATLRRDNARLSGDLHTVARRLTHDLRTPLNSISTANEALAALAVPVEPASTLHRAISTAVGESGGMMGRVATVLLASARPSARQSVDMEEIVWNAREKLHTSLRSAGATILAPEKWPVVSGVPGWLEFVWTNLLSNSVEHGGTSPRIELGWTRSDAHTSFWVRDSGVGVAPAKRAQLFYPFDRLNELNAPRGYGLSLVHRLIELQGGTTGYTPDPAPGGAFYFTLPEPK